MKRVVIIDGVRGEVREGMVASLEGMQRIVGGNIELAHILPDGHELYVNEEFLFDDSLRAFFWVPSQQTFKGSAFVIGGVNEHGDSSPAEISAQQVEERIIFGRLPKEST